MAFWRFAYRRNRHTLLECQHRQHAFFNRALRHQVNHLYAALLPQAMHATNALLQYRRILRQIHIDHRGGSVLQVKADAACVGGKKQATDGIVIETVHQSRALVALR